MKRGHVIVLCLALCGLVLLTGCTTVNTYPMQNAFSENESVYSGGPPVTLIPIQESMSDPNKDAPYHADPNYLGQGLNTLMGYGPLPMLPFMIKFDKFQADASRVEIVRAALLSQMNSNGIPVLFKSDNTDATSISLPEDRLNASVSIREMNVDTEMSFFLTLIIDSAFEYRNQVAHVVLDCKIWQPGQSKPVWEGSVAGSSRTKDRLKQLPQTFTEIVQRINVVKEAVSAAVGQCVAKLAEVRTKVSNERYARLLKEGAEFEASGDTAKALEDYGQASISATTAGQDDEAMQSLTRLLRVLGTPPALPEEARKLKVQAEAAYREGRFEDASQLYADTTMLVPWWAEGHSELALLSGAVGHYSQAIREMKCYVTLAPNAPDIRNAQDKLYEWEQKMTAQASPASPSPSMENTNGVK